MTISVQFRPVDTWFFRDGVPFGMGSSPQENVASMFPPHPPTVVGALRAALARSRGWNGLERWDASLNATLGNGPNDLGRMKVDGPFVLCDDKPLFRTPRHLLGVAEDNEWKPKAFLGPGEPVESDIGSKRFPSLVNDYREPETLKNGDETWLTAAGMIAALSGRLPDVADVVPSGQLWKSEPRIGLEREDDTRAAAEGMLYSTQHVRPASGVSLGARIRCLPNEWSLPPREIVPLGGESRLAECDRWDGCLEIKRAPEGVRRGRKAALIALSPLDLDWETLNGEKPIANFPANVVSVCMDRPQKIGGWNSLACRPLPMRSVIPAGSVLFCEMSEQDLPDGEEDGLIRVGARTEWGFGLAALGVWPQTIPNN